MSILETLVNDSGGMEPLKGVSVLACTYDTTATAKMIRALVSLGAQVTYVPVSHGGGHAARPTRRLYNVAVFWRGTGKPVLHAYLPAWAGNGSAPRRRRAAVQTQPEPDLSQYTLTVFFTYK